jgi:pimeloyl-ACP methyl ester carboxylesterase
VLPALEQMAADMRHGDDATRSALADTLQTALFGAPRRAREPEALAREKAHMLAHDPQGQDLAARAVFERDDVTERLGEIAAPTLVLCGTEDVATGPDARAGRAHPRRRARVARPRRPSQRARGAPGGDRALEARVAPAGAAA